MEVSPSSYYEATNALTKIQLALQMLDRQAPLARAEHQLVTLALRAATDLTRILSDTTDQVAHETEPTKTQRLPECANSRDAKSPTRQTQNGDCHIAASGRTNA